MEKKYLIDTNIFLEILLAQEKENICKSFLLKNISNIVISDFSFHSIGIILYKLKKLETFLKFWRDINSINLDILNLSFEKYPYLVEIIKKYNLDFDDAYQISICNEYNLTLVTLDNDFKKLKKIYNIMIL